MPPIPAQYPVNGTRDTIKDLFSFPYVTITLFGFSFQKNSGCQKGLEDSLHTTSSYYY